MKFLDIQQNTDDWLQLRVGKIGGSSIGTIMACFGKAFGDPAHKLAIKLAVEQLPLHTKHVNNGAFLSLLYLE